MPALGLMLQLFHLHKVKSNILSQMNVFLKNYSFFLLFTLNKKIHLIKVEKIGILEQFYFIVPVILTQILQN